MSRLKTLAEINVTAHPHPDGIYRRIFESVVRAPVRYWGPYYAAISPLSYDDEENFFFGRLAVWTQIPKDSDVLNLQSFEELAFSESSVNIPRGTGLDSRLFSWVFDERSHRLIIELVNEQGKKISAKRAEKALSEVLEHTQLVDELHVNLIPDHQTVQKALGLAELRKVEMKINKPNPDHLDDEANAYLDDLEQQGAKSQEVNLTKAAGVPSLALNDKNQALAQLSALTGYLKTSGKNAQGEKEVYNTQNHPRIIHSHRDDHETVVDLIKRLLRLG